MARNPNGYGGITKLKGTRRRPYFAYISEMQTSGTSYSPKEINALKGLIDAVDGALSFDEVADIMAGVCTLEEFKEASLDILAKKIQAVNFERKQVKKPIGYYATRKEAQIALAKYNAAPYDLSAKELTFAQVWELAKPALNLAAKSTQTQYKYKNGFEACQELHDMPITALRLAHLQAVIDKYADTSASRQAMPLDTMRAVFKYAVENDIIEKNYAAMVKLHKKETVKRKPLTEDEIKTLWQNINYIYKPVRISKLGGLPVARLLLTLVYTGMRINELLAVKKDEVNIQRQYIVLHGTKTAAADRLIPIHAELLPVIETQLQYNNSTYLFSDKDGGIVDYNIFTHTAYNKFCDDLNYEHTVHEHRHTFATYSALQIDSQARAFIMGHKDGITDSVYTHPELIIDRLVEEVNKMRL